MPIKIGDIIEVEYIGMHEDGTIFDSSEKNGRPLKFQVGMGQLIKGFEAVMVGREKGDEFEVTLEPSEAYGEFDPLLVEKIKREDIPSNGDLMIGKKIEVKAPNGMSSPGWIRLINEESIIIDMNHPLAGKVLKFKIKILETDLKPDTFQNPFIFGCDDECSHH